jgi:BirA family biotin operon repressor/biotin-[acetyl-CoA-carboxylase] ligase
VRAASGFWGGAVHDAGDAVRGRTVARGGTKQAVVPLVARVFAELTDGRFHSGEELARALGVTRSAVWKGANALRKLGTPLHAVRNRGYRLSVASEPLDSARIRGRISRGVRERLARLDVAWSVGSTNTELLGRDNPAVGRAEALLAEFQTAGRGRRGRAWLAPPGGAVCFSLSWTFPAVPHDAGALSLAIGVCVLRALEEHAVAELRLKWPNDILLGDRKLGGILIELRAESAGPACAVVGVGLNMALSPELLETIAATGLEATDLGSGTSAPLSRNAIAAAVIEACVLGLVQFQQEGLGPFIKDWREADALRGRAVAVQTGENRTRGIARGIDLSGALLVETPNGLRKFFSGEVTVRPAE